MTAGKGPLRFRRKGAEKWHRSTRQAKPREYRYLTALCGYIVPPSIALFLGYDLSIARVPAHGELCAKCEAMAREEEEHDRKFPNKKEGSHG